MEVIYIKSFSKSNDFYKNGEQIASYNIQTGRTMSLSAALVLFVLFLFSLGTFSTLIPTNAYFLSSLLCFFLHILSYKLSKVSHSLWFTYIVTAVCYFTLIYLSVIVSPNHRASAILGAFCLAPVAFIDKAWRNTAYTMMMCFIHTALSFYYKGVILGIDDAINCFAFATFGIVLGVQMNKARIRSFELKTELEEQRNKDYLTGLNNRRKMYEIIDNFKTDYDNAEITIIMCDIDYFKHINDNYGHLYGDTCLIQISKLLLKTQEESGFIWCRYGGEEFLAVGINKDISSAKEYIETLQSQIYNLELALEKDRRLTFSFGISNSEFFPELNVEKVINKADIALYHSKISGRNMYSVYNKNMSIK